MSDDRKLDPVTADFISAAAGGYELCDVIENKIAFSYSIAVGSWEGDPTLGHEFDELDGAQNIANNRIRLADLARKAVKWLIDSGELSRVDIAVESLDGDKVAFEVDYYLPGVTKRKKAGPFLVPVGSG